MILTKIIETDKARLLVVSGLPEDAFNIAIWARNDDGTIHELRYQAPLKQLVSLDIPKGDWQILDRLHHIGEEQWKGIVERPTDFPDGTLGYANYCNRRKCVDTATESGLSLVEANCKLRNCVPPPEPDDGEYYDTIEEYWEDEQETVFTNPVVFIDKL